LEHISIYIDILVRWNFCINLTAIRTPEEIVTRHFGESLFAASRLFPCVSPVPPVVKDFDSRRTVADVGTGAGFPGLPLKIWNPALSLTLIESNHKKATFLREITRALTLTDVNIQITRAESIKTGWGNLRAVEFSDPHRCRPRLPTGRRSIDRHPTSSLSPVCPSGLHLVHDIPSPACNLKGAPNSSLTGKVVNNCQQSYLTTQ
jgi:hypothetical protein